MCKSFGYSYVVAKQHVKFLNCYIDNSFKYFIIKYDSRMTICKSKRLTDILVVVK